MIDAFRENKDERIQLMDVVRGANKEEDVEVAELMRLKIRIEEQTLDEATGEVFEERFEFAEDLEVIGGEGKEKEEKKE